MKKFATLAILAACTLQAACATTVEGAGEGLTKAVTSETNAVSAVQSTQVTGPALLVQQSANDFETTLQGVKDAVDQRGFKTFAVIDHAAGAASIDASLPPTTLVIFGNPQGGTPLMQSAQTMGIVLPLKVLVYQQGDGAVMLAWPDMAAELAAHGVTDRDILLGKIQGALSAIVTQAGS